MVDRLLGLRLDPVVGRNHDHGQVRNARAARSHRCKRLVPGGVQEGDLLIAMVDLVGADVLRDAPSLARGHLGLADRVQQRGLAVVHVPHDRHHRRPVLQLAVGVRELRFEVDVVGGVGDLDLLVELVRQHLDRVIGQRLRQRGHLAERHQLLDHLWNRHAEVLRDLLDRGARVDPDHVGRLHRRSVDRRDRLLVGPAPAPATARSALRQVRRASLLAPGGLGIDHHAPAPARTDLTWGALTGTRVARGPHPFDGRG